MKYANMQNHDTGNTKPLSVLIASSLLLVGSLFFFLIGIRSLSGLGHDLRIALIPAIILLSLAAGLFLMRKWAAILSCALFVGISISQIPLIISMYESRERGIQIDNVSLYIIPLSIGLIMVALAFWILSSLKETK